MRFASLVLDILCQTRANGERTLEMSVKDRQARLRCEFLNLIVLRAVSVSHRGPVGRWVFVIVSLKRKADGTSTTVPRAVHGPDERRVIQGKAKGSRSSRKG